jgi:hypothetical protein
MRHFIVVGAAAAALTLAVAGCGKKPVNTSHFAHPDPSESSAAVADLHDGEKLAESCLPAADTAGTDSSDAALITYLADHHATFDSCMKRIIPRGHRLTFGVCTLRAATGHHTADAAATGVLAALGSCVQASR